MTPHGNGTLLIVVEAESFWPSWLGTGQSNLAMVRQRSTETLADLKERVGRLLGQIDARGGAITYAIFVQSDRCDSAAILTRVGIAGRIVSHMSERAAGRLVIVPAGAQSSSARAQAALLAEGLRIQVSDLANVTVVTSDELNEAAAPRVAA